MKTSSIRRLSKFPQGLIFSWAMPARTRMECAAGSPAETVTLKAGEIYRLEPGTCRWEVEVLRGCVWITQAGLSADFVFHTGEIFHSAGEGVVLLEALEASTVTLHVLTPQTEPLKAA